MDEPTDPRVDILAQVLADYASDDEVTAYRLDARRLLARLDAAQATPAPALPDPDRWSRSVGEFDGPEIDMPVWDDPMLGELIPYADTLAIGDGFVDSTSADEVERSALTLLAVARYMREGGRP